MKYFTSFVLVFFCFLFLIPEETIVEKVDVDWWVVPLFTIDSNENSITDLKKDEIELLVNGKSVSEFDLYKRAFNVISENKEKSWQEVKSIKVKSHF